MRELSLRAANYILFIFSAVVLASLQGTLWMQAFGYFPAPHIWLPCLVYWTLHRQPIEGIFMVYLLTFVISPLTAMPMGILLLTHISLFVFALVIKQRFYWSSGDYFMSLSAAVSALFPWFHLAFSWMFEDNPITDFLFFDWVMRALLTALAALPLYRLFRWFDKISQKELLAETGNSDL